MEQGVKQQQGQSGKYDITAELKSLFDGKVDYQSGKDLKQQIASQESAEFFRTLMKYLSVTLHCGTTTEKKVRQNRIISFRLLHIVWENFWIQGKQLTICPRMPTLMVPIILLLKVCGAYGKFERLKI